jgi:hypothetical protein
MGLPSLGLPSLGLPSLGLPSLGLPSLGLPSKDLPSLGLSSQEEEECYSVVMLFMCSVSFQLSVTNTPFCWISLCSMSFCWMSLCWISLCRMSLGWMSWRLLRRFCRNICIWHRSSKWSFRLRYQNNCGFVCTDIKGGRECKNEWNQKGMKLKQTSVIQHFRNLRKINTNTAPQHWA